MSVGASVGPLLTRIARLEQAVASLQGQAGGGESLSPNYLTLGPNGSVGANFTGLINALGLIIPAGLLGIAPQNEIAWVDAPGNIVATAVGVGSLAGGSSLTVASGPPTGPTGPSGAATIEGRSNHGQAFMTTSAEPGGTTHINGVAMGSANITFQTDGDEGSVVAAVMDSLGHSSFAQFAAPHQGILRAGGVTSAGAVGTPGTGDWTSVRNAAGDYSVVYTTPGGVNGHLVYATPIKGSGFVLAPEIVTASTGVGGQSFQIQFFDPTAAQRDTGWTFLSMTL